MDKEKISLILNIIFLSKKNLSDLKKLCLNPRNDIQIMIFFFKSIAKKTFL